MNQDNGFTVKKIFNAPAKRVFSYFTEPLLLGQWHAPNLSMPATMSVNLVTGGSYRFEMNDSKGNTHVAVGVYEEIIENQKLVFTWNWEGSSNPETTVTILFKDQGDSTEVELIHTGFSDKDTQGHHNQGWIGLLSNLENALA